MENTNVVNPQVTPEIPPVVKPIVPEVPIVPTPTPVPAPGSKTDSELLLKSLQEERDKRKALEAQLAELTSLSPESLSDEGKVLNKQITELTSRIDEMSNERNFERVVTSIPELRGLEEDFKKFSADYPRNKLENVAQLFLVEKGIVGTPARKGLEKPSGGGRGAPPTGMSTEEIADLRTNNFKKYLELLNSGKIQPKDIK